ncbi:MAG: SnoaL-like domain-containing protein [Woeseiaceae bacterium]|nr:SnoaL-like domain-containing protein [Woeseiaceae bacterium]
MDRLQAAKTTVRNFQAAFDSAGDADLAAVLAANTPDNYFWRGMHPFYEQEGAAAVADTFWLPLRRSLTSLQRREDIFLAGLNDADGGETLWVVSMGHMMGLFDSDWIGIPATHKLAFLRYAEFHRVANDKIVESAFFCDVIGMMRQAGHYPLPPQTGADFLYPGPRTRDGRLFEAQSTDAGKKTMALVNRMIADLGALNVSDAHHCPPELLAATWHDDMIWYGPCGIGATYTIPRYQQQHQFPFRRHIKDKTFNGHVARFAEGNYAGFFGWANLTNTPTGGFLGLPGNEVRADMRVVDIYRRDGDKLAENWVLIDLLHYLAMQGLDVLGRLQELRAIR